MLEIVAEWDDSLLKRRVRFVVASLKDTSRALRIIGDEIKRDSARRFAEGGPGWAPRKPEELSENARRTAAANTRKRAEQKVRTKLKGDIRRALRRQAKATDDKASARSQATVERRYAFLRSLEYEAAGGVGNLGLLTKQQHASLSARLDRAYEAAESKPLLGRMAGANRVELPSKYEVVVRNVARNRFGTIFSGVHNDGGKAGRGATEPKREFLSLTPEVMERVPVRLADMYLRAWERAK